jgi:hypothetical protein
MAEAPYPSKAACTSMWSTYKVFEPLHMQWMGIWNHRQPVTTTLVQNGDCHPPAWEVRPPNPNPCWTWGEGQQPRRLTEPRSQSKKNPPRTKLLKAHPRPQSTFAGAEAQNPQSMGVSVPQPELPLDKGQQMRELEVRHPSVPRSPGRGEALIVALFGHAQSLG